MASTCAAAVAGTNGQFLLGQRPQDSSSLAGLTAPDNGTPSQAEFNAFADAMSTSYGAPVEVMSINPDGGQQSELADTSATNLLAELPVLETVANGVNLGPQLADGTQLPFAATAGLALQVAAEPARSRQDQSVTIHNTQIGNPTQIRVYAAGDRSRIHDVAPSLFGYIKGAIRPNDGPDYYAAFVPDPYGRNIEAVCNKPAQA